MNILTQSFATIDGHNMADAQYADILYLLSSTYNIPEDLQLT